MIDPAHCTVTDVGLERPALTCFLVLPPAGVGLVERFDVGFGGLVGLHFESTEVASWPVPAYRGE